MLQTVGTTRMAGNFDGVKTPIWAPLILIQASVQIVGTPRRVFFKKIRSVNMTKGSLRSENGEGRENVAEKVNSRSFDLHRNYSKLLTLSNVGEP